MSTKLGQYNKIKFFLLFLFASFHFFATDAALIEEEEIRITNRTQWLKDTIRSNLNALLKNTSVHPNSRDLTSGALAVLLLDHDCDTAISLLRQFGTSYDMSFGGESIPAIFYEYFHTCFVDGERRKDMAFFTAAINRSLPQTIESATTQDRSYTNMYLMAVVTSMLFGEMSETIPTMIPIERAQMAKEVGYEMWNKFYTYTSSAGIHEFVSPTYSNVQLSALYMGYMYSKNVTIKSQIEHVLDYIWLQLGSNYYGPSAQLTGPHSRDYDFLLSHGMVDIDLYAIGNFKGMFPLTCEMKDPHCEGAPTGWSKNGTGEPMTIIALDLLNIVSRKGYKVKQKVIDLSLMNNREIRSKFLGQHVTANGNFGKFGDLYNFIHIDKNNQSGYSIGSASQELIVRTHGKYVPYQGSKLINIVLGSTYYTNANNAIHQVSKPLSKTTANHRRLLQERRKKQQQRPVPTISLQTDFMNSPYGLWKNYPKWNRIDKGCHLASHPGHIQNKNVLLATTAIDTLDLPDGFVTSPSGVAGEYVELSTNIILPLHADDFFVTWPNGTTQTLENLISKTSAFNISLPLNSTISLRVQTGGLAIKIFEADFIHDGKLPPSSHLVGDELGISVGAIRLVCSHFRSNISTYLDKTHIRFAALIVAESVKSSEDLKRLGEKIHKAKTVSRVDKSKGEWEALLLDDVTGDELLAVTRNLTCSEKGAFKYNQTLNTTWNCLISRRIFGVENKSPSFLEVNGVNVSPIFSD